MPEPYSNNQNSRHSTQRRFGNYELVRRIDVGGMGEVYLARQRTAFGREVAIKIMRPDLVHDPTARQRFLREAEVNAHLKHEHILPLIEFGEEQGRLFFVTPYIEGGTLARRLQNGPLPLAEVYALFTALVQAVAYIHRRGVIHRDLKPGNILLDRGSDGKVYVRLIDFGIATIQGQHAEAPLTTTSNEMGTLAYLAPERLKGVASVSNDIYSLGVILYQMLTGQLPDKDRQLLNLPEPLAYVIRRATAEQPGERFGSAEELLAAFEYAYRYLEERGGRDRHAGAPARPPLTAPAREPSPVAGTSAAYPEMVTLQRSEELPRLALSAAPDQGGGFTPADYDAPTLNISKGALANSAPAGRVSVPPNQPPRRGKSPWPALIFSCIALALLLIGGLLFLEVPALATASINITPRTATVSQIFTITASLQANQTDTARAIVPAHVLSESKTLSQRGPTSGHKCVLGIFDCKPSVDILDEIKLVNQVKQTLVQEITRDLQRQLHARNAQQVGDIAFSDINETTDPPVGSEGSTVTVTLTEQGSVEYFLTGDVRSLVLNLLGQQAEQKLGGHFQLKLVQIGQMRVNSVDTQGTVTLKVPAAALAQYSFSQSDLDNIKTHIKGLKLKQALAYLQQLPGIDPASVSIHLSGTAGDTLPDDPQRIQIIPVNPANLPPVQLPAGSGSPTPGAKPTAGTTTTPQEARLRGDWRAVPAREPAPRVWLFRS
jgi:serine/threonine protein kinase